MAINLYLAEFRNENLLKSDPSHVPSKNLPFVKPDIGQNVVARDYSSYEEKWLESCGLIGCIFVLTSSWGEYY